MGGKVVNIEGLG